MKTRGKKDIESSRADRLRFFNLLWFPVLLALLFTLQNQVFNDWVGLSHPLPFRTLASFGTGLLVFGPAVFINGRWRQVYLVLVSLATTIVFASQFLFYGYTNAFLQSAVIKYFGYAEDLSSVFAAIPKAGLWFFASGAFIALGGRRLARESLSAELPGKEVGRVLIAGLVIVVACYGGVIGREIAERGSTVRLFKNPYDAADLVKRVGVINYSILDLRRYLMAPHGISDEERQEVINWASFRPLQFIPGENFGVAKGRNVIFIQLESFEHYLIGKKVGTQEITPNLNRLKKNSLFFSNYFFQAGQGRTSDAEFTTANSIYYTEDRTAFFDFANRRYQAMPKWLADNGYDTASFHANHSSFWNRRLMYKALGYRHFFDKSQFRVDTPIGWGMGDREFLMQSVPKLKQLKKPFYAYFITLTQHTPFDLPDDLKELRVNNQTYGFNWLQSSYLQVSRYVDRAVGEFIDELKRAGLYENSIIVVDGDHTGFVADPDDHNFARFLGHNSFDRLNHLLGSQVPLMIHIPGTDLKGSIDKPASHLDLFPTISALLGIHPPASVLGQDVFGQLWEPLVVKRRGPDGIEAIFTERLIFLAADDSEFEHSRCLSAKTKRPLPLAKCRQIYERQLGVLRVSDLALRGDIIERLGREFSTSPHLE